MPTPKKPSGLKGFGKPQAAKSAPPPVAPAEVHVPRKDTRLAKSVRVTRAQWRRIRELETDTEKTFQALCIDGLNKLFQERGLEQL
jgi:Spy/CpxP family protein refolding chaperone